MTIFSLNLLFIFSGIFLAMFAKNRHDSWRLDPANQIIYRYFLASLFVSLAMFATGIPALVTDNEIILSYSIILALLFNTIGFNHFFLITIYSKLQARHFIIARYALLTFAFILTAYCVIVPPASYIDIYGIAHWGFDPIIGLIATIHMDIIFAANIFYILAHFYRLKKLSIINTMALILTFIFAGISGSYLYVGDSSLFLLLASIGMYLGTGAIFFSVMRKSI